MNITKNLHLLSCIVAKPEFRKPSQGTFCLQMFLILIQSEAEVFNWKSSAGKLEEEIDIIKQQKKELEVQLEKCSLSEQQKCCSLEKVKEEIGLLSSATEELMEELEVSHTFQKEQKVEIESLKKICTIKGDVTHEVVRLKDALTGGFRSEALE